MKKVRFSEEEADLGGAIRNPRIKDVPVDVKRIEYTEALAPEGGPLDDYDTDSDEELGVFTHMGGRLSGRGAAYDPPHVAQSVLTSLQAYPEIASTYLAGRVTNPRRYQDVYGHDELGPKLPRTDARATMIDYGGSLPGIWGSVDGYLHSHHGQAPQEFHLL